MTRLLTVLSERFTDKDEIETVAIHGCSSGVSDFIYSSDLYEFFNEFEDDIEEMMDEYGVTYDQLVPEYDTIQQLREAAVWFVVETYCQSVMDSQDA